MSKKGSIQNNDKYLFQSTISTMHHNFVSQQGSGTKSKFIEWQVLGEHCNFVSLHAFQTKSKIIVWSKNSLQRITISHPLRFSDTISSITAWPKESEQSMKIWYPYRFLRVNPKLLCGPKSPQSMTISYSYTILRLNPISLCDLKSPYRVWQFCSPAGFRD